MGTRVNGSMQRAPADTETRAIAYTAHGRFRVRAVRFLMVMILSLIMPQQAWAQHGRGYIEMDAGYKTGDFGTPTRADLLYLLTLFGYVAPAWDVSVTAPYLVLSSGTASESGAGDIILRVGRVLVPEGPAGLSFDGALAVKLPTADERKGLGTGETDYGAFLGLRQRLGGFKVSLHGGYISVGDPPRIKYNDIYLYGVGISRIFGFTELAAYFEGRRASVPGALAPQEITIGFFHVLNADFTIRGSAFSGLNDGGPDFGFNAGIVRWF